ncbi:hypothetical protein [Rhodovulum sulfidophilum]|uniref:hypothetical protein n=1 Tax=Rhodovulum sulfidophilum TaxID=35806 RepID=UPI001F32BDF2|nr:hypothetical protein [Rhodovulum sulfidophilum]MCE8421139.1 hypothetical protein [Rhodovulum sulfidophilum]MCE8441898.1 hypothetical protein [Rhodovulum sulfidophilum]MCE8469907.1 hypothetical protein [Rhodovulum sulfidophilum]
MSSAEDQLAAVLREAIPMLRTLKEVVSKLDVSDEARSQLQEHEDRLNQVIINGKPHTWDM